MSEDIRIIGREGRVASARPGWPARLVLDTSVLFAMSVVRPAPWAPALRRLVDDGALVLRSDPTDREMETVLGRVAGRSEEGRAALAAFLDWLDARSLRAVPAEVRACADPSDDVFLGLAVAGGADVLATSDKALLDLDPFCGVRVLRPSVLARGALAG